MVTRSRFASHFISAVCAIALLLGATIAPAAAVASPRSLKAARIEAARAQDHLDDLAAELEERSEEYLAAREELEETRRLVTRSREDLAEAEQAVATAEERFQSRITSIYRRGHIDALAVFLGVRDFRDFVTRLDLFRRVGDSDAQLLGRLERAREDEAKARRALEARRAEQTALVRMAGDREQAVKDALGEQQRYLDALGAKIRRLVAEERARQQRIARERARAAAAAAAAAARARSNGSSERSGEPHADALAIARSFVGKVEYEWGGTTPDGFDCSGLTMYSYRQVGINIPRTSRQQFRFGTFIARDRLDLLEPGDLVFFGRDGDASRVHHVGIYAGDGMFVHAPQTGMKVSESSLTDRIARRHDYVGARRP